MLKMRPLLILLAAATLCTATLAAQTQSSTDTTATSGLYGVFIPMSAAPSPTATPSEPPAEVAPSLSSNVPTADLLRTMSGADYLVQPGDIYELRLVYYWRTEGVAEQLVSDLVLESDYSLSLPLSGSVTGKGKTFAALRSAALTRIRESVATVHVDLRLKTPALFRVFVAGAVSRPGYVAVSGLMRVSDALQAAGGTIEGASLRKVRLRRGDSDSSVDLLYYATGRDPEGNPLVAPNDSIFVPVAQTGVQIKGRIRYAGLYELVAGETIGDLLELAGGMSAGANRRAVTVTRIDESGGYAITKVDLAAATDFAVRDGDIVSIPSAGDNAPMIVAEGALFGKTLDPEEPAKVPESPLVVQVPYSPGITLLGVLDALGGPTPTAEADRSFILRGSSGRKIPVDVAALWKGRDASADLPLEPGDRIVVPTMILNVAFKGELRSPGMQAFVSGFTVADYLRAAGGITPTRGTASSIHATSLAGKYLRVGLDYEPAPGDTIEVGKLPIAAVGDFFGAYVFPVTGLVVGVLAVVTTVLDFIARVSPTRVFPP